MVVSTQEFQIGRFDIQFTRESAVLNTQPSANNITSADDFWKEPSFSTSSGVRTEITIGLKEITQLRACRLRWLPRPGHSISPM